MTDAVADPTPETDVPFAERKHGQPLSPLDWIRRIALWVVILLGGLTCFLAGVVYSQGSHDETIVGGTLTYIVPTSNGTRVNIVRDNGKALTVVYRNCSALNDLPPHARVSMTYLPGSQGDENRGWDLTDTTDPTKFRAIC